MPAKKIFLRKIGTGGTLIAIGRSAKAVIKRMRLDPTAWEEITDVADIEVVLHGSNQSPA